MGWRGTPNVARNGACAYSRVVSTPKKHHFVPQFLLRGFADDKEALVVHGLDPANRYFSKVRDVGHQNDGHTLFQRDGTADRETLEAAMSQIEGDAADAVRELADGESLTDERKAALSWFLAMQWHRSRYLLDSVASELNSGGITREQMQTGLLRVVFVPFFSAWHHRDDMSVRPKYRWDAIESQLHLFRWSLCRYRADSLVLGDQTVCLYGVRKGGQASINDAWARHGIGIGWDDVGRVTVALTPRLGLLLGRTETPTRLSASDFNRTTIYNARRFVVHSPAWPYGRENLQKAFNEAIDRQRWLAPVYFKNQL